MKKLICILLTAIMLLALFSCQKGLVRDKDTGAYYDKKNDVFYRLAPVGYEAIEKAKEAYTSFKGNEFTTEYFEIRGLDPKEFLVSQFGDVIYSTGEALPELDGFEANGALLCYNSGYMANVISIAELTADEVKRVTELYDDAESGDHASHFNVNAAYSYTLKLTSEKYAGLYYSVSVRYDYEGHLWVYDPANGRGFIADDILADYIEEHENSYDEEE